MPRDKQLPSHLSLCIHAASWSPSLFLIEVPLRCDGMTHPYANLSDRSVSSLLSKPAGRRARTNAQTASCGAVSMSPCPAYPTLPWMLEAKPIGPHLERWLFHRGRRCRLFVQPNVVTSIQCTTDCRCLVRRVCCAACMQARPATYPIKLCGRHLVLHSSERSQGKQPVALWTPWQWRHPHRCIECSGPVPS